jgi:hypothetical protein
LTTFWIYLTLLQLFFTLSVMRQVLLFLFIILPHMTSAQDNLYEFYEEYKEAALTQHRFAQDQIQPIINAWKSKDFYTIQQVGASLEDRPIYRISAGTGPIQVLLWSQMHGDESTATMAIFDILNYLYKNRDEASVRNILSKTTIHFVPMLNPDGAESFTRRNAQHIDINRDAIRLQTPEGQLLKHLRDSLNADFGFNLHDQSRYYNVSGTGKTATLSFLAPAYNVEKDINSVREKAMKLIVRINEVIQKYAPGHVGRYSDTFEPRAFGDNIQKWGTSTILIESGGYPNDPEKQEIRKLNYVAILTALSSIATGDYEFYPTDAYEEIPQNDRQLVKLKIHDATISDDSGEYVADIGMVHNLVGNTSSKGYYYSGQIEDIGDLSTYFAYDTLIATGFKLIPGKIYHETLENVEALETLDVLTMLKNGYGYVRVKNLPEEHSVQYPFFILSESYDIPRKFQPGGNPAFFMIRDGSIKYAVVNGFLYNLDDSTPPEGQGIVLR